MDKRTAIAFMRRLTSEKLFLSSKAMHSMTSSSVSSGRWVRATMLARAFQSSRIEGEERYVLNDRCRNSAPRHGVSWHKEESTFGLLWSLEEVGA